MNGKHTVKMGNVVEGAGDLIAISIALDLSLFGRTKKPNNRPG